MPTENKLKKLTKYLVNERSNQKSTEKETSQESILEMTSVFFLISNYDCLETEYSTQELFLLLIVKFSMRYIYRLPSSGFFMHK